MLNALSIWLVIDRFFHGFTSFLAFDIGIGTYKVGLLYIAAYFLLPFIVINYFLSFRNNRYRYLENKFPQAQNKTLVAIHFIGSFVLGLICLYINIW